MRRTWLGCVGGLAVVAEFHRLVPQDPDTPWHIANGRLLLHRWASGDFSIGRRDSFSWTARGAAWHANGWGFDALAGGAYDVGRWVGVAGLRLVLLGAVVALAWKTTRQVDAGGCARAGAVWATAVLLVPFSAVRPGLASFVLLLTGLLLTAAALDRGRWMSLVGLAVVVAVWADIHGVVVAGVVAIGAACVGDAIDRRRLARPLVTALVAAIASCCSPVGPRVWSYALTTSGASLHEHIQEWQRPSLHRGQDIAISLFLVVVAAAGVALAARGRVAWQIVLPALALTALAFQATRNEALALLASVPVSAAALTAVGQFWRGRGWSAPLHAGPVLGALTAGALLGGVIQMGGFTLNPDPLRSPKYPFVSARGLPAGCRLLNEYNDGGFLILTRPDVPVSQDGRNDLYGDGRLDEQDRLLGDSRPGVIAALDRLGVTCVLAHPGQGILHALAASGGWRRLAFDREAEAWASTAVRNTAVAFPARR